MRKLMAVFAVLILLLCSAAVAETVAVTPTPWPSTEKEALGAAAPAAETLHQFSETWMAAQVLGKNVAWVLDRDGQLFRWDYSENAPVFICTLPTYTDGVSSKEDAVSLLFTDGNILYALNRYTGRIGTVTASGLSWIFSMAPDCLLYPDGGERVSYGSVGMDGQLYLLVDYLEENPSADYHCRLLQINLQTGAYTLSDGMDVYRLSSIYSDQLLLMGNDGLMVYDPATDSAEKLSIPPVSGGTALAYDESTDAIYLANDRGIYRSVAGDEFSMIATMPGEYAGVQGRMTGDGRYAFQGDGVWVMRLSEQENARRLTVMLHSADPTLQTLFAAEYPSVLLNWQTDSDMTAADVADTIRSGDTTTAVFSVKVDSNFSALVEKGFVSSISNGDVINSVNRMYPALSEPLRNASGEVVAYPWDFGVSTWVVNQTLWEEYFPDTELPTTWKAFFLLMQEFEVLDNDEGDLFLMNWDYEAMLEQVLTSYITRQNLRGETVDFTAPVLIDTLRELNNVRQMLRDRGVETYAEDQIFRDSEVVGGHSIFHYEQGSSTRSIYLWNENALPAFVFKNGDDPVYTGSMRVLVINSNFPDHELAEAFIAQLAKAEYGIMRHYIFHADATEPYAQGYYDLTESTIADWQSAVSAIRFPVDAPLRSDTFTAQVVSLIKRYAVGQLDDRMFFIKLNETAGMVVSEEK